MTASISVHSALDVTSAQRLARLCGIFGSAHDGEVINAARMADRVVRELGLTWPQIIVPTAPATFQPLACKPASALEWRQLAAWVRRNFSQRLNAREHQFIIRMSTWRGTPSPKQAEWLTAIVERFAVEIA